MVPGVLDKVRGVVELVLVVLPLLVDVGQITPKRCHKKTQILLLLKKIYIIKNAAAELLIKYECWINFEC